MSYSLFLFFQLLQKNCITLSLTLPICSWFRFDFSQEYIPHGYKELCLSPTQDGEVWKIFKVF